MAALRPRVHAILNDHFAKEQAGQNDRDDEPCEPQTFADRQQQAERCHRDRRRPQRDSRREQAAAQARGHRVHAAGRHAQGNR
jgi:hypothetical protein